MACLGSLKYIRVLLEDKMAEIRDKTIKSENDEAMLVIHFAVLYN